MPDQDQRIRPAIDRATRVNEAARVVRDVRPGLKELLLGDGPRFDLALPKRGSSRSRKPPIF